jgi:uncharacterized protein YbaA (DUF1428 family)
MAYIDGFVIAVPTANKQKFIEHATTADSMFLDMGANRVIEGCGNLRMDPEKIPCLLTANARSTVALRR